MKQYIEHLNSLSSKQLVLLLAKQKQAQTAPVAVLGTGCRLPGNINSLDTLWHSLMRGDVHTKHYPNGPPGVNDQPRWHPKKFVNSPALTNGAYLSELDITANPLNLNEQELLFMDPQHRLLLECTLDALHQAGLDKNALRGKKVGIFIGISAAEYLYASMVNGLAAEDLSPYMGTGVALSSAPGRIAMLLQSEGPTLAVDSACSSALSALHQAKLALRSGECDYAITGASHLLLSPYTAMVFDQAKMLAQEGIAKVFDVAADGHVRDEGAGVLLLCRKDVLQQQEHKPLAWVRGTAIHQQGQRPAMSVSTGLSQQQVISQALQDGLVQVEDIDYVEAHATGGNLGAQVEMENLAIAYRRDKPLYVGSHKANFGHLEAASGIVSLLKSIALLQQRQIPAQVNLQQIVAEIQATKGHLKIPQENMPLESGKTLYYGVSSFGFTGTNSHAILQEDSSVNGNHQPRETDAQKSLWPTNNLWN